MNDKEIKAAEADQLLNNPMFIDAFVNVRENLVSQIEDVGLDQEAMSNQLMLCLQCLKQVKKMIVNEVNTGKLEQAKPELQVI